MALTSLVEKASGGKMKVRAIGAAALGPVGQRVISKLQDKGLVGLVYGENGLRHLTNSKRPVAKMRGGK
jgi:TRAP-type C4-dicarboxylate transport system substrate-binding protein